MQTAPKAKRLVLALAISTSCFMLPAAHATVTNWGVHGDIEYGVGTPGTGAFADIFTFTLPIFNNLDSVAVANNLLPIEHVTNGTVSLYQGIFGDAIPDVLKMSYGFNGTTGSTQHTALGLTNGGSYYYKVSGIGSGSDGGFYTLSSSLLPVPVPEAETYMMLMAGVGLMGWAFRRRNQEK